MNLFTKLQLMNELRSMWSRLSTRNPITPMKIRRSLEILFKFIFGACVLWLAVWVGVTVSQEPQQVLPAPTYNLLPHTPTTSVLAEGHNVVITVGDGSRGRGTLIAPDLVVTVDHLVRDSKQGITVYFPDGTVRSGTFLYSDTVHDMAAIVIPPPKYIKPAKVSPDPGYLSVQLYDGRKCKGVEWKRPTVQTAEAATLVVDKGVESGASGGGIYNGSGLYGIIWGSVDGQTYGTCGAKFRAFVKHVESLRADTLIVETDIKTCAPCALLHPILERLTAEGYRIVYRTPKSVMPYLEFHKGDIISFKHTGLLNINEIRRRLACRDVSEQKSPAAKKTK